MHNVVTYTYYKYFHLNKNLQNSNRLPLTYLTETKRPGGRVRAVPFIVYNLSQLRSFMQQSPIMSGISSLLFHPIMIPIQASPWLGQTSVIVASSSPEQIFAQRTNGSALFSCTHTQKDPFDTASISKDLINRKWIPFARRRLLLGPMLFNVEHRIIPRARRRARFAGRRGDGENEGVCLLFSFDCFCILDFHDENREPKGKWSITGDNDDDDDDRGFSKDNELLIKLSGMFSMANHDFWNFVLNISNSLDFY